MADDDDHKREKGSNFYGVLGLRKECTTTELRNAYKKLAMRWHPDRCSATGNAKFVEEAKKKFQAIQEAYSVLSDADKRFMYDVGVYDNDDDDNGMGDFLNEMSAMMSQTKCSESGEESFEKLQELFEEMFQEDINAFGSASQNAKNSTTSYRTYCECSSSNNKRNSTEMNFGKTEVEGTAGFDAHFQSFCLGTGGTASGSQEGERNSRRRNSRRSRR